MSASEDGASLVDDQAQLGLVASASEPNAQQAVCTRDSAEQELLDDVAACDSLSPSPSLSLTKDARPRKKPPRRATEDSPNVCYECKTTDSKLWRRGPDGNLMCNACGLRWRRSSKTRGVLKTSPRKRKLPDASSVSPPSTLPRPLPQSSMIAAQKGGTLNATFATNPELFGMTKKSKNNFGQLQYQPQNIYLHNQQQLERARQTHYSSNQLASEDSNEYAGDSRNLDNSSTPIERCMTPNTASEGAPHQGSSSVTPGDTMVMPDVEIGGPSSGLTNHVSYLPKQTYAPRNGTHGMAERPAMIQPLSSTTSCHPGSASLLVISTASMQDIQHHNPHSHDLSQTEDFSGLLSLKAFVEDGS